MNEKEKDRYYGKAANKFKSFCYEKFLQEALFEEKHERRQSINKYITKDDIINLRIALNTTFSVDEFLEYV